MADYTQTYINNDMSKLNTVLQTLVTNGIVGAVDYDSSGTYAVFKIYADAEKTTEVFRITQAQGSSGGLYKYTLQATASDAATLSSTGAVESGSGTGGYIIRYGYACSYGVLLSVDGVTGYGNNPYTYFWVLITKNQNGDPVFVWTNGISSTSSNRDTQILTNMNTEYIVASSDVAPLGTVSRLAPTVRNQMQIAPFVTCCAAGDVSYTPDAGRVLTGDLNELIYNPIAHEITFDGATWLTNGYWVLKVGAAS